MRYGALCRKEADALHTLVGPWGVEPLIREVRQEPTAAETYAGLAALGPSPLDLLLVRGERASKEIIPALKRKAIEARFESQPPLQSCAPPETGGRARAR